MGQVEAGDDMSDPLTLGYFVVSFAFITAPMLYLTWHSLNEDRERAAGS